MDGGLAFATRGGVLCSRRYPRLAAAGAERASQAAEHRDGSPFHSPRARGACSTGVPVDQSMAIIRVHSTEGLLENALRHGKSYRRPVYDSLYLVLATALARRALTGDRRLYNGVHGGPLDDLMLWVTDPLVSGNYTFVER
jgi:hypothetical protein